MKKLLAVIAIIGIVFSSCNGKYTIAKRKYNKGFYVSKSSNTNTKPSVANAKTNKAIAPEEKVETVILAKSQEIPVEIAPVKTAISPIMKAEENKVRNSNEGSAMASVSKNNYTTTKEVKPIKIDHSSATLSKDKGKGKGDANLIVMVILCFFWFLNLIAVYMHDGGVTTNFWITLLLDLIIIGGIIFSLLVVLDIVDLS